MISSDIFNRGVCLDEDPSLTRKVIFLKTERFNQIVNTQLNTCKSIMQSKAKEYATEDRLHNFRVAAVIQRVSAKDALAGMMAKHTVSVYDMCGSEETFSQELWDEKITDSINYLLLLRALIQEEELDNAVVNPKSASRK